MQFKALSWNLFHGRDFPPDPGLFTWRSRLLRRTERNASHVQVNRDLLDEFAELLASAKWDVALLQECPPRFAAPLARACDAEAHCALTSRNSLGALRSLAARLNPDLIASAEGGSNLTLVRTGHPGNSTPLRCSLSTPTEEKKQRSVETPSRCSLSTDDGKKEQRSQLRVAERRAVEIHAGRPERRTMALTRIVAGGNDTGGGSSVTTGAPELCVANLHATNRQPLAIEDVRRAAETASEWADDAPLLFGGDLNLRPAESSEIFAELRERFGLAGPTGPQAIDHLLARGLEPVEPPRQWPPERRELREDGLALRLSDHAPVAARFVTSNPKGMR